jgi:hypothetical protein
MTLGVDGKEKPVFAEGTRVSFDYYGTIKGTGVIRGKASEHVVDLWIVEVESMTGQDPDLYPWACIVLPHTTLKAL